MSVESNLKAFGVAQVIVSLKGVSPGNTAALDAEPDLNDVCKHFKRSQSSPAGALALVVGRKPPPPCRVYKNLGLILGTVDPAGYSALRDHKAVRAINDAPMLRLIRPVGAEIAAEPTEKTWGITRLNADKLWDQGLTGDGVIVGHLDTGIDGKHPALGGAIASFAEFDDLGERIPGAKPNDSGTHGTHTAGTIVGRPVDGRHVGVAPGAKLASAMVIERGDVIARILGGMDWVIGEGAKILSMSLGIPGYTDSFIVLMQAIRNQGILPVIAVGNEGPGTSRSPGNYDIVLSVGAFDENDLVADFSSSQRIQRPNDPLVPDLVGPGVAVLSSVPGGKFAMKSGTSMATPHIAGFAALLWEAKPSATVSEIENAILGSCTRPATMLEERANRGVPDAVKALTLLKGGLSLSAKKGGAAAAASGKRAKKKAKSKNQTRRKRATATRKRRGR